ncbi:uncharacterized protein Dwil_GK20432 [Drosophila willistoni]|uniref:GK20432 n=1 Tax=Drosophila willistoni TaxID=7260 RepID=B4N4W5_DROWI|nr:uncharacterized protein LOC6645914 [Drosophila willistoni]EDW79404.1 uncharacterized protein Dwil_GK20432 [Drosophila willistoni]
MVSPRKSATTSSNKVMATTAKSCESLFSASSRESASLIYQRKQMPHRVGMKSSSHGSSGIRQPSMVPQNTSEIHQRVMSARNLRMKTFQNQLADAQAEIANLAHENRMLRTLHKRQSSALNKYESTNAELPQLLHSHSEELRVWQTKHRNLQAINKDLEMKLKQKEALILSLSDQNKHYSQLNKDKNLDERQKLQEKLRSLEQRLQDKDNDMKLMARKVQLETKNFRQQLLNEQKKGKEVMLKLEKARLELSGYRKLEEYTLGVNDKGNPLASGRRPKLGGVSMDEPDKIDKLEKSLELLDKAIEKNNQSEFNALADVLETDSMFDFDKVVDVDDKNDLVSPTLGDSKIPSRVTKLPTPGQAKQMGTGGTTRSSLSHLVSAQSKMSGSGKAGNSRLRSGAGSIGNGGANIKGNIGGSANKRRDTDARLSSTESKSIKPSLKSFELDYDEDFEDHDDADDSFGLIDKWCDDVAGTHDNGSDEVNANEMSLVNYGNYMDNKNSSNGEIDAMLEEDEDEDEEEQTESQDSQRDEDEVSKPNPRGPRMKENMSSIRKQISNDHKERESFLNAYCRQSSSSNVREDAKKRTGVVAPGVGVGNTLTGSRKHSLLAALKVIDDNKGQD